MVVLEFSACTKTDFNLIPLMVKSYLDFNLGELIA